MASPVGSCLGVRAVGEVGDGNTVGEDLLGGQGHAQDRHLPELQGGPLTAHVHQLIHDGILGPQRDRQNRGYEQMAWQEAPKDRASGQHTGRAGGHYGPASWHKPWMCWQSAQDSGKGTWPSGPSPPWAKTACTWVNPPGDRWPSQGPRPGSPPQISAVTPGASQPGQVQDSHSWPGGQLACRPCAPARPGSHHRPRRVPLGPPRLRSGPRPAS